MRELTLKLRFTQPCLGRVKLRRTIIIDGVAKKRSFFIFERNPIDNRVMFMAPWWKAIIQRAAEVQCRLQKEVQAVRFLLEVDGTPRSVPDGAFKHFYKPHMFSLHEQFAPGDVIGVTCVVPSSISDDDFWSLMDTAGQYYGISAFGPRKYGFFRIEGLHQRSLADRPSQVPEESVTA